MPPTSSRSGAATSGAGESDPAPARGAERLLVAVVAAAALALTWPIFPLVSHYRPTVLGLPFSLAWVIFWLLSVFAALAFAFRRRHGSRPQDAD